MNQKKNSKILIISIILTIILIIGIGAAYIILATDMFKSEKKLFFKYVTQVGDSKKGFISEEVTKYFEKQKHLVDRIWLWIFMDGSGWNHFTVCTTYDVRRIYKCRGTDLYVNYFYYCNPGKLSLGMAGFQIRNKEHFHCICIFLCGCTGIADHIL